METETHVFNLAERLTVILNNKVHKYRKGFSQGIKHQMIAYMSGNGKNHFSTVDSTHLLGIKE